MDEEFIGHTVSKVRIGNDKRRESLQCIAGLGCGVVFPSLGVLKNILERCDNRIQYYHKGNLPYPGAEITRQTIVLPFSPVFFL